MTDVFEHPEWSTVEGLIRAVKDGERVIHEPEEIHIYNLEQAIRKDVAREFGPGDNQDRTEESMEPVTVILSRREKATLRLLAHETGTTKSQTMRNIIAKGAGKLKNMLWTYNASEQLSGLLGHVNRPLVYQLMEIVPIPDLEEARNRQSCRMPISLTAFIELYIQRKLNDCHRNLAFRLCFFCAIDASESLATNEVAPYLTKLRRMKKSLGEWEQFVSHGVKPFYQGLTQQYEAEMEQRKADEEMIGEFMGSI